MYSVLDVSRYVINYSNDKEYGISNLKLQKVLYFIQADFLVCAQRRCFRERIEAWDFGPVVPEAYREYKKYGGCNIPRITSYFEFDPEGLADSKFKKYRDTIISREDKARIEAMIDRLAAYSSTELVEITQHQAPWMDAFLPGRHSEITSLAIQEYFSE